MFNIQNFFPVDQLPPLVHQAVMDVARTGASVSGAASVALGVISAACQNAVSVKRPNSEESSTALNVIIEGPSGCGKTYMFNKLSAPLHVIQERQIKKAEEAHAIYEANLKIWEAEDRARMKDLDKCHPGSDRFNELAADLRAHQLRKPKAPLPIIFLYRDATPQALSAGLNNFPSASIMSDEGGSILAGQLFTDPQFMCNRWDSAPTYVARASAPSFHVKDDATGILLMTQPETLSKNMRRGDGQMRYGGFSARTLFDSIETPPGTIFINVNESELPYLRAFHNRVTECVDADLDAWARGEHRRRVLMFTDEGVRWWVDAFNEIQTLMRPGNMFAEIPDFASKLPENIARMAALFHYFEGMEGDYIEYRTLQRAGIIGYYYAAQHLKLFSNQASMSMEYKDFLDLYEWCFNYVKQGGPMQIVKNHIRQYGPSSLRSKVRLDQALYLGENQGRWQLAMNGKVRMIVLNPQFFSPRAF